MRALIIGAAVLGLASNASAGQRDRYAGDRAHMLQLAHELEAATASVHHTAEGTAHHPSRGEHQALRRLHELNREARHFHRQAERYRPSRRHLHNDFGKLARRLWRAATAMHDLHALRPVRRDLRRIAYLMDEISVVGRFGGDRGHRHARAGADGRYRGRIYTDRRRYRR
jgi:hypothetical protein